MNEYNDGGSLRPPDQSRGTLTRFSGDEMSPTGFGESGALGVSAGGAGPEPASAETYLSALYRHKWLALVVSILIAGSTVPLVWTLVVPQYRAHAVVRVSPIVQRLVY